MINSKRFSKRYYARHIKEGLVHYLEDGEDRIYLIKDEALKKMNSSFEGKPIYIRHVDKINMDTLKEDSVGVVVKSFYNEFDGAWWVEIMADDEAQSYIEKGWAVSNAYLPTELGSGGVYHDIDYAKEVKNGVYEHLAIVDNPRYEEAVIMTSDEYKNYKEERKAELEKLKNSKENEMLSEEDKNSLKEELLGSLKNSLADLVKDAVKNAVEEKSAEDKKNAEDEDHRQLIREIAAVSAKEDGDFEGGLDEKIKTIIGLAEKLGYSKDEAKTNAEDEEKPEEKEDEKEEEEAKDNEADKESDESEKENKCNEDEEKEKEEKKENSKFFAFLHNAKHTQDKSKAVSTMGSGLALGRARYGSNKENK